MKKYEVEELQDVIYSCREIIKTQEQTIKELSVEIRALKDMLRDELIANSELKEKISDICQNINECL